MHTQTIQLSGLTCEACTKITSKRIGKIQGVNTVSVDLATQQATVISQRTIDIEELRKALGETGYGVKE